MILACLLLTVQVGKQMLANKRRIWFISELFYPVCTSTGYYITEIARSLAVLGKDVGVICTTARYRSTDSRSVEKYEKYEGIEIFRVISKTSSHKNVIHRFLNTLRSSIRLFREMFLHIGRDDCVVAVTNPPIIIPFLYFFKFLHGSEYSIIVHDLFPENLPKVGVLSERGAAMACLRILFRKAYAHANKVICIGRDMADLMGQMLGSYPEKIVTIPNWADDNTVKPIPNEECAMLQELGLRGKIVLEFAGNLGRAQNIEILIRLAKVCCNSELRFLFIGDGVNSDLIKRYLAESGSRNTIYLQYIDRSKQNEFLNSCDIGLISLCEGMYGLGVPSKAYNIMAAGKPILFIGDRGSEIFTMVEENDIGWAFESSCFEEILAFVNSLGSRKDEIIFKGKRARSLAQTTYSKECLLMEYRKTIVGLLDSHKRERL